MERQAGLIRQELAAKTILFEQGLHRRSDLFTVERAAAEAEGALGRIESEPGDMRSPIARLDRRIAEILPRDKKLVIETLIDPTDIGGVHQGQAARVGLTGFNQCTTPQMRGHVTNVSADTVPDPRPGRMGDVYVVRVALSEREVERVRDGMNRAVLGG